MKLYFHKGGDDESCHDLEHFKNIGETQTSAIILELMQIEYNADYFWCTEDSDIYSHEDADCGCNCKCYRPRNGKNGRCRFSRNPYEGSGKFFRLTEDNKLIPIDKDK